MQFSVRHLLALLLLCGLAFPIWLENQRLREALTKKMELYRELDVESTKLAAFGGPEERAHLEEEYASMAKLAEFAKAEREAIQKEYSKLEAREADVVSLRRVPQWRPDSKTSAPVGFVLHVPESREVWLRYALAKQSDGGLRVDRLNTLTELPAITGYTNSGLFQQRLKQGRRTIRYVIVPKEEDDDAYRFQIWLDDTLLLESQVLEPRSKSTGWSSLGGDRQADFPPKRKLPWLFSARVESEPSVGEGFLESEFRPTIWLSAQRSEHFADFPGETTTDE